MLLTIPLPTEEMMYIVLTTPQSRKTEPKMAPVHPVISSNPLKRAGYYDQKYKHDLSPRSLLTPPNARRLASANPHQEGYATPKGLPTDTLKQTPPLLPLLPRTPPLHHPLLLPSHLPRLNLPQPLHLPQHQLQHLLPPHNI